MKQIGIKLADGTFFPILEEGKAGKKSIDLPTKGQTAHKPLFANALLANTNKVRNIKIKKKQTNQGQKFISKTNLNNIT